jgi:hypothetical protein
MLLDRDYGYCHIYHTSDTSINNTTDPTWQKRSMLQCRTVDMTGGSPGAGRHFWFVADPGTPAVPPIGWDARFIMDNFGLDLNLNTAGHKFTFSVGDPITAAQEQVFQLKTDDETAIVSHKAAGLANTKTKLVLEHYNAGLVLDAKGYFAVEKPSLFGTDPFGELMVETSRSSLYLGASGNRYQRIFDDNTARFGEILDPNSGGTPPNWDRWSVEVAPQGNAVNGIRVFEPERGFEVQSVLAISANAKGTLIPTLYAWPTTTAGGTIATGGNRDSVIGLFPYKVDGNDLDRNLIITASGNMAPSFNDAIKLKHDGGIDIWGDTEFFDTVTAASFVGPVTGDITGNLTGNVTGDVTGDVTGNLTGNVTGDVTGDLTGNVTGDVTGNVTGDLTGDVTGNLTGDVTGNVTGNVTGDVTGDLWGSVYATDGSGPVLTSPATTPGNVAIDALGATGIIELNTNSTLALTVDTNQDVHIDGDLYVNGDGTNTPYIIMGMGASTTVGLEIGHLRTSHGSCYIDFNTSTSVSQCARITRAAESNPLAFDGVFEFVQEGIGDMEFQTNSALAMSIDSSQNVTVGSSASSTFSSKGDAAIGSDVGAALATLSVGANRSADGASIMQLHDGGVSQTDFFMKRHDSATAVSELGWEGAGDFRLTSNYVTYNTILEVHPAGSVDWETNGLNFDIKDNGVLTFRHSNTDTHSIPRLRTDDYILVESAETEPTTFSNYALISTQNTIIASGQWNGIMMAGAGVALDANHFGFTDQYVYVNSGDYELQLDQEVADGCAVICTSNFADPTMAHVTAYSGIVATVAGGPGNAWPARTWLKISARSTHPTIPKPDFVFSVIVVGPQATWTP